MVDSKKLRGNIIDILLLIAYKAVFDFSYCNCVEASYGYMGDYVMYNPSKHIIAWIIFILLYMFTMYLIPTEPYKFIYKLLYIFSITGTIALYGIKDTDSSAFIISIVYWIIFALALRFFSNKEFCFGGRKVGLSVSSQVGEEDEVGGFRYINAVLAGLYIFCVVVCLYVGSSTGFRIVTEFASAGSLYRGTSGIAQHSIMAYLYGWIAMYILPLLFFCLMKRKHYIFAVLTFPLLLILFSADGNKIYLLNYIIAVLITLVPTGRNTEKTYDIMFRYITLGIILLTVLADFLMLEFGYDFNYWPCLIYRSNGMPSAISYYYVDFFQNNELLFFRQSILRFLGNPYDDTIAHIIGANYAGSASNGMNNGLIGDAFSNLGYVGIVLFPFMIAFVFNIYTQLSKSINIKLEIIFLFSVTDYLLNISFFTWLLSGGVIISYILIWLICNNVPSLCRDKDEEEFETG